MISPAVTSPSVNVPSTIFWTTLPALFINSIDDVVILILPIFICSESAFISESTAPSFTNFIDSDVINKSLNGLSNEPKS